MELTIVGAGEVGRVVERAAFTAGAEISIVRRGQDPLAEARASGPVVVAVRETDLPGLIEPITPLARRAVFLQNGLIEDILAGLPPHTRGLVWFTAKGDFFEVLAPSIFFGSEAAAVAGLLEGGGIAAREEKDELTFRREIVVKLAWNNVVGLPLAIHHLKLADYLESHTNEARAIVEETCQVLSAVWEIQVDASEAYARLLATTAPIGWVTGGKKAIELRNGAIARLARAHGVPAPVNTRLVEAADHPLSA